MILQWTATDPDSGQAYLITYWESSEHIEVCRRIDRTRWSEPFVIREVVEGDTVE